MTVLSHRKQWASIQIHLTTFLLWFGRKVSPASLVRRLFRLPYILTPQILRHLIFRADLQIPSVTPTTYLDGLRGWAALAVLNYHFFFAFTDGVATGYGFSPKHHSLWTLPGVRLLYDGATCVNIFFVIAGYVCSAKALQLMTSLNTSREEIGTRKRGMVAENLVNSLAASVFRRFFRLYMPVMCITFMSALAAYVGLFEPVRPMLDQRKIFFPNSFKFSEPQLKRLPTLSAQLAFWRSEMTTLGKVFREAPFYPDHDNHLWTIQFEFRMSMHLYIVLLGLVRCSPRARIFWLAVLSGIYLSWDRWEGPLFFFGAALAQLDVLKKMNAPANLPRHGQDDMVFEKPPKHGMSLFWQLSRWFAYLMALYFMCFPIANYKRPSPGFKWMNHIIPTWYSRKEKFPKSIGVLVLVYLLATSTHHISSSRPNLWHRLLTCKAARYFGKNMFGMYLVHGPIMHFWGYGQPHFWWRYFGKETAMRYFLGLGLGWAVTVMFVISAADVFTREIDARCAKFIKWVERVCFVEN